MSDSIDFVEKNGDVAWSLFLAQHVGKVSTERFVKAFYDPLDLLDVALSDLLTKRGLDTAVGQQLDGIGSIVGLSRSLDNAIYLAFFGFETQISGRAFGEARLRRRGDPWSTSMLMGDADYRMLLRFKIALNNGQGTAEQVMAAFDLAFGVRGTSVIDRGNANATVVIPDLTIVNSDPRSQLLIQANPLVPRAGGVKFWFLLTGPDTFGFVNQKMGYEGFGRGTLARRLESNRPAIRA